LTRRIASRYHSAVAARYFFEGPMIFQDHDLEDREYPDEPDDDGDETAPCPYCRRAVYDDAEQCPYCGNYLSREDAPRHHPWWWVVGVLLSLVVVMRLALWW
jgi:hypothetical protein